MVVTSRKRVSPNIKQDKSISSVNEVEPKHSLKMDHLPALIPLRTETCSRLEKNTSESSENEKICSDKRLGFDGSVLLTGNCAGLFWANVLAPNDQDGGSFLNPGLLDQTAKKSCKCDLC